LPPHDEVYQYQFAPVPKKPPDTLSVEASSEQIIAGVALAEVGIEERVLTVTVVFKQVDVLQVPSALT